MLSNYPMRQNFEILALELKLQKTGWLIVGTYKSPSLSDITFTSEIKNVSTFYRSAHDQNLVHG